MELNHIPLDQEVGKLYCKLFTTDTAVPKVCNYKETELGIKPQTLRSRVLKNMSGYEITVDENWELNPRPSDLVS